MPFSKKTPRNARISQIKKSKKIRGIIAIRGVFIFWHSVEAESPTQIMNQAAAYFCFKADKIYIHTS